MHTTVTVSDVVTALGGSVGTTPGTYIIFSHTVNTATIQAIINRRTRFFNAFFMQSTLTQNADLVDDAITLDSALRLMAQVMMGTLMVSGFSYSVLEHSVNLANFPQINEGVVKGLMNELRSLINQLDSSGDFFASTAMGTENFQNGLDQFQIDSLPDSLQGDYRYSY